MARPDEHREKRWRRARWICFAGALGCFAFGLLGQIACVAHPLAWALALAGVFCNGVANSFDPRRHRGHCPACGYELGGATRCPECGRFQEGAAAL